MDPDGDLKGRRHKTSAQRLASGDCRGKTWKERRSKQDLLGFGAGMGDTWKGGKVKETKGKWKSRRELGVHIES